MKTLLVEEESLDNKIDHINNLMATYIDAEVPESKIAVIYHQTEQIKHEPQ